MKLHSLINKTVWKASIAASLWVAGMGVAMAQSAVTLTAAPTSITLPDGQTVPMWGYTCGAVSNGGVVSAPGVSCTAANGLAQTAGWQPPLITVPAGQKLTITLVNQLSFNVGTAAASNSIPTSLVIVGQLGGGLGSDRALMPSPAHAAQGTTWPGTLGTTNPGDPTFVPPAQAMRVRSMATEVTAGNSADLVWTAANLRPGTYLIESGTQASIQGPMGLYGMLVVTDPAATTAVPQAYGQSYDKDVALLLSEIDPLQNAAVDLAVHTAGFSDTKVWNGQAGECGDVPPSASAVAGVANTCYPPAVNYSPLYYLINGVSFDRTAPALSALAVPATGVQGRLLLRFVNAGLRMHVPSVVGANLTLLAEDGNKLPGLPKVQSSLFLPAGKTYDATIQPTASGTAGTYAPATYAVFDRALGLSTNNQRDGGMVAQILVAGGAAPTNATAVANPDTYKLVANTVLAIAEPAKGVMANDVGVYGVTLLSGPSGVGSSLVLNRDGTFTYVPGAGVTSDSFRYCANGSVSGGVCASGLTATVSLNACTGACLGGLPVATDVVFTSNVAARYASPPPGVLGPNVTNASGLALTALGGGSGVTLNPDGSFVVSGPGSAGACPPSVAAGASCVAFTYQAKNSQGGLSNTAHATVVFLPASNLVVNVKDAKTGVAINDYRWIIEEDRTFWIEPKCQVNSTDPAIRPASCPPLPVESLGYNFHTANMPVVAQGCVGTVSCESGQTLGGVATTCDVGNGACRTDTTAGQKVPVLPGTVHLDPAKRYFISVLPGDGINPTVGGAGGPDANGKPFSIDAACGPYTGPTGPWEPAGTGALCGHEMGGSQIAVGQTTVNIALQQTPLPTAKISVFVFQDDNPLNGENDAGGGVDVIAPNEPGLGGFEIKLFDQAGGLGDNTGQITYDMFNMPVSNSLAGKIDPMTGLDSCPITHRTDGLVGMIPTCPKYEADGVTPSPLAGQAVIANLYPGLYEIQAYPAADRIARGEEWLQTNTLDGGKPHEAFIKPNEPGYFQEFGPGGFHVAIGFANPAIINARKAGYCAGIACNATLKVQVTNNHMSRTPDQRTFSSETYDHYGFTQCYVSVGPADAEDFALQKCDANGMVTFTNMPTGVFKMSVFDQWNDIMLDGLVSTVSIDNDASTKVFPVTQWRTNLFTRTFIDTTGTAVSDDSKPGLALVNTNIRYRDGSYGFYNNTDLNGYAGFNEVFPFMNWLVVETSSTRFKPTGVHSVYDAGGPVDCSSQASALNLPCTNIAANLASTSVHVPLPPELRVPGGKYCDSADCPPDDALGGASTGTVFPPQPWGTTQGWQGLLGQNSFMEFGVKPFNAGENGGIQGNVIYASTRPFDDPSLSLQLQWEPGVPRVKINLYQKTLDDSGLEKLVLVDSTLSTSFDDWAQGFRKDASGNLMREPDGSYIPNMNCPGQDNSSPFFATLKNSKQWLDTPDASGQKKALAYQSQFKCYDGWSQLNQAQPAPYDGMYSFPSVLTVDPASGKPASTNCHMSTSAEPWGCVANTAAAATDWNYNAPMLVPGKYVVEVIVPPGYELVKEEDKNILLGDVMIAPVTQQFAGLGNVFIMPDQAAVNSSYNANSPGGLNKTSNMGSVTFPRHEGDTGSIEAYWPCVGAERIVPDLNSLFPQAGQAAPFAGAKRRLCDRKEVSLTDQASVLAKFYIFSSTHIAGHFTGTITNDFASEFDPFSPQFGEKFGPPNLPVGIRDFNGSEVARVYSDQWGIYNGLYFSSWSVNPPNPTGYAPQMAIACMNDPGPILAPDGTLVTDPAYNPAYSNFCYETPFMPGFTAYMDTPVIPTQSFADNYNLPDSEYPDQTPAVMTVVNSVSHGPWVSAGTAAQQASVAFTLSGVAQGDSITSVLVGSTSLTGTTAVICSAAASGNCTSGSQSTRNSALATLLTTRINANTASTGYSATRNAATVTISAAVGSGATPNGTPVAVNTSNVTVSPSRSLALAGGAVATPASMDLTITALGDKVVQNPFFTGPNATTAPFNQKTITRHYGFGTGGTVALVGGDGVAHPLTNVTWSDLRITGTVPSGVPNCTLQQRNQPAAQCGELVITRSDNGRRSIDAVTVTVGGSAPWMVTPAGVTAPAGKSVKDYGAAFGRMGPSPIQVAIDSADPGDLILVSPGTYRENLIMWKPVRLQGLGAAVTTINADAHPAGKMDQWRRQINCVFGLNLDGVPNVNDASFDAGATYSCPQDMHQRVDRIPFEAIVGWDASGNGNLAQVLQEPTLMGAYEGAGITVLGRGVRIPANSTDFWGLNATGGAGAFTDGSVYLGSSDADCSASKTQTNGTDYGTSNFLCNPSRIDGVSILNSSQGGGGVFIHGWGHRLEVANTRISGNHGTLAGAINLGNGETPDAFINDGVECGVTPAVMPCPPTTWNGVATADNAAIPFQFNTKVRIHHNMLYNNASIGDALFSGTPAGAGAITVSAGSDGYQIDHNWIAGNLSTGDGGGLQHLGLSFQGKINNNYVLFNQSTNPTLPTNGGGIVIEGANLDRLVNGVECGSTSDVDCPPGLGEGIGAGMVVDANLILGNSAESGSGGGLRIQQVNGTELGIFNTTPSQWYDVTVTNNIIANNVAGWDGGGVSIQDALKVSFVNNTVVSNDTTASAGVLFKTLGAIMAASAPPGCTPTSDPTQPQNPNCLIPDAPHNPQPAGLVTMVHTPNLLASMGPSLVCPSGYGYSGGSGNGGLVNADCRIVSKPQMTNDLFWQNRAFSVNVVDSQGRPVNQGTTTPTGSGLQSQQNLVALTPALNQTATGQCAPGARYWDVGFRDDPSLGSAQVMLNNSILTTAGGVQGNNNVIPGGSPVLAQFCNGARAAPESCSQLASGTGQSCNGYNAPPGASETTGLAQVFVFNGIKPTATVDEGHNWLNLSYGPLTLNRAVLAAGPQASAPELMIASGATGATGGAYAIPGTSPAVNRGSNGSAPATDFFGNPRPRTNSNPADIGAVEYQEVAGSTLVAANPTPLQFTDVVAGTGTATRDLVLTNNGTTVAAVAAPQFSVAGFTRVSSGSFNGVPPNCGASLSMGASCTVRVQWTVPATPTTTDVAATVSIAGVSDSPVPITANAVAATYLASVSPAALNFGNWGVGSTSGVQSLTITNTGNSPLTGLSAALASAGQTATGVAGMGINAPGFNSGNRYASGTPTVTVAAPTGALCSTLPGFCSTATVSVTMSPSGVTPRRVTGLTLVSPGSGYTSVPTVSVVCSGCTSSTPLVVNLNGLKVVKVAVTNGGSGYLSAPGVVFAPAGASATTTVTAGAVTAVSVTGGGTYTSVPTVTFAGNAFTVASGGSCGATLAVGASCQVNLTFAPSTASSYADAVHVVATGATVTPSSVALSGAGVAGAATLVLAPNPLSIVLDSQAANALDIGSLTQTGLVTLTNTAPSGAAQVAISSITVSNAQRSNGNFITGPLAGPDGCTGVSLAPGASCTVTVRYTVGANASRVVNGAGTLRVNDNAIGAPQSIGLVGVPTP